MNSNVSKPFPTADTSNSRKKSKRKKRKNKYKHSSINRKYPKKCYRPNSAGYCNYPKTRTQCFKKEGPSSWKIMSNWYWSNYKKAFEWQDKHKIAHWKACAFALQEENRCLMQLINSMQPGMCPSVPVTMQDLNENTGYHEQPDVKSYSVEKSENLECGDEEDCEDEYEFEMSEEMMEFFEKSFKHKMDLQKQKEENQAIEEEKEISKIQSNKLKRSEEMQLLYGDSASMIIGMETAVQLSFDKFCDTKSPKFWPNIPLRL